MEELLVVKNLVKHYPIKRGVVPKTIGFVKAVDGISFSIERGTTLGLVGESGSGKTTAGRCILKLVEPTSGEVWFEGRDLEKLDARETKQFRRDCQIVFQDPYGSLNPRMTIGAIIEEPLLVHNINGPRLINDRSGPNVQSETIRQSASRRPFLFDKRRRARARDRAEELLNLVGIPSGSAARFAHELSGGQRQRVCIARALTTSPRLIVCDEPVSSLDVSVQAQILNLLVDLQQQLGLTYLFIAHDLAVVKHISSRVAVMYLGQIVEEAATEEIFSNALHPYTKALLASIPVPDPGAKPRRTRLQEDAASAINAPAGCRFRPRCPIAIEECETVNPPLIELSPGHKVACLRAGDCA